MRKKIAVFLITCTMFLPCSYANLPYQGYETKTDKNIRNDERVDRDLNFKVLFGRVLHNKFVEDGFLRLQFISGTNPSSVNGLRFNFSSEWQVLNNDSPCKLQNPENTQIAFSFDTGSNIGYPDDASNWRLIKQNEPLEFRLTSGNGIYIHLSPATTNTNGLSIPGTVTGYILPSGAEATPSGQSINLQVTRNNESNLSSIYPKADGEMTFPSISEGFTSEGFTSEGFKIQTATDIYWEVVNHTNESREFSKDGLVTTITNNTVSITKRSSSSEKSFVYKWLYNPDDSWTLAIQNGRALMTKSNMQSGNTIAISYATKNSSGTAIYQQKNTFTGIQLTSIEEGTGITTTYSYYDNASGKKSGKVKLISYPDGYWEYFDYDIYGRLTNKSTPFKDSAYVDSLPSQRQETVYSYTSNESGGDIVGEHDQRPRKIENKINGTVVKTVYHTYKTVNNQFTEIEETASTPAAAYGTAGNLVTTKKYYYSSSAFNGWLQSITFPDGRVDEYQYEYGLFTSNSTGPGAFAVDAGNATPALRTTMIRSVVPGTGQNPEQVWKTVEIHDNKGNLVQIEEYIMDSGSFVLQHWTLAEYNSKHQMTNVTRSDNVSHNMTWDFDTITGESIFGGLLQYAYSYGDLYYLSQKQLSEPGNQFETTTFDYNAEGKLTSYAPYGKSATTFAYDTANRLTGELCGGNSIIYAYTSGGAAVAKSSGGQNIETTSYYKDRRIKQITSAAGTWSYDYGVDTNNNQWMQKVLTNSPSGVRTEKSTWSATDKLIKKEINSRTFIYAYENGKLKQISENDKSDTVFTLDQHGNITGISGRTLTYEVNCHDDFEDGGVSGWFGPTDKYLPQIENVVDPEDPHNRVLKLSGKFYELPYTYNFPKSVQHPIIKLNYRATKPIAVYVWCQTSSGLRVLRYDNRENSITSGTTLVHIPIDLQTDGKWQNFQRNLDYDLKQQYPELGVTSIYAVGISGECYIDNIQSYKYDDSDNDLIPDFIEQANNLDPASANETAATLNDFMNGNLGFILYADADNDGLSDSWEAEHFGDLTQTPSGDYDNNGLTNGEEFLLGYNFSSTANLNLAIYTISNK